MDVAEMVDKMAESLSVRRAFGAAYERDGLLIIPVAFVAGGGGGGAEDRPAPGPVTSGSSQGTELAPLGAADDGPTAGGSPRPLGGMGGGFGGVVFPVGVYVVQGDKVRWVPAVDVTRLVIAWLSILRMVVLRSRHGRHHRRHHATGTGT